MYWKETLIDGSYFSNPFDCHKMQAFTVINTKGCKKIHILRVGQFIKSSFDPGGHGSQNSFGYSI